MCHVELTSCFSIIVDMPSISSIVKRKEKKTKTKKTKNKKKKNNNTNNNRLKGLFSQLHKIKKKKHQRRNLLALDKIAQNASESLSWE